MHKSKKEYFFRKAKNVIPWRLRYGIKILEAQYPGFIPDIFKQTSYPEYYNQIFYDALNTLGLKDLQNKTVCEMGPGQLLLHAFLSFQLGAEKTYLLEIADFAGSQEEVKITKNLFLSGKGWGKIRKLPKPKAHISWNEYLAQVYCEYHTDGLNGYKKIPDNSVDIVVSFAVTEHIRKNIFKQTMQEMHRFMRSGGTAYHTVDLTDHFGGGKNHLRFEEDAWENSIHYRMDNYTNRLSCSEICSVWRELGFTVRLAETVFVDAKKQLKRQNLAAGMRHISDEDLNMAGFTAILKKP